MSAQASPSRRARQRAERRGRLGETLAALWLQFKGYRVLARRVRTLLEQNGVTFVNGANATAILEIPLNEVVTSVLTIADNARVREYRISHTVQFRLTDASGAELLALQTL